MGEAVSRMYVADDWLGPPWRQSETVLLLHGIAESSRAWFAWVPHLAREFRVVRPDLPGFGRSPAAEDQAWSAERLAADVAGLLDRLGIGKVHVVSAKYGGTVGYQFAADYPERTLTLSVISGPVRIRGSNAAADIPSFAARIRTGGVPAWAAATQRARLGTRASEAQIDWWNGLMGSADPGVCIAATAAAADLDITASLPRIQAPTLVVTTEGSALHSVETVRADQQRIPHSRLLVLPGDSYHIAAAEPDLCARHVLDFIRAGA